MKYLSETFRKGVTESEDRVVDQLHYLGIPYEVNMALCFECCNKTGYQKGKYPEICNSCGTIFNRKYTHCLPDIIFYNIVTGNQGVIQLFGEVHDKDKRKKLDKFQVQRMKAMHYKIFVIRNEEIEKTVNFNLRAMLVGFNYAVQFDSLYETYLKGEKEIACLI